MGGLGRASLFLMGGLGGLAAASFLIREARLALYGVLYV
jgi:myosin-crossreactive antigen